MDQKKIPVAILGATGMVGQRFIELLIDHPWFEIIAITGSEKSVGKRYGDAAHWMMTTPIPENIADMAIEPTVPLLHCDIVFSALDSKVAGEIEDNFAKSGYLVISNSSNHRMDENVPLLIPEVNPSQLSLIENQLSNGAGAIITNPNCSAVGIAMSFKPLLGLADIESAHIVTMQAISGAGYPGVSAFDITDNIIPHIAGEERKIQIELPKIFANLQNDKLCSHPMQISAQCNRVPVIDGHTACISLKLKNPIAPEELIKAWNAFESEPQELQLPSAPKSPVMYLKEHNFPQPKMHRNLGKGMCVTIGRLRPCSFMDLKFVVLSHNTIRGAAGGALLNAELLVKKGYLATLQKSKQQTHVLASC